MKVISRLAALGMASILLFGCASLERYKQADEHKHRVRSLAVLPLIVGDEDGRIEKIGGKEFEEFVEYFNRRFFTDFESTVKLANSVVLKLPRRDFDMNVYNGMDYLAAARELGVDAVLGINLTMYNEIKPGAKGAQIAASVATFVLLGGYVKERQVAGYDTHYAYLDIEQVDERLVFEYYGNAFPTIEEQREFFVDQLIAYLDARFPLSTDYTPVYKE